MVGPHKMNHVNKAYHSAVDILKFPST